jgi:acyl-CoA thioesterase FadM
MNSSKASAPERTFDNCLARRASLFAVKRIVTLGKTNALGGAYFAEFFAWTGEAREELLAKAGGIEGIILHTSEARMKYLRELKPFEEFEIVIWPRVNRMKLSLRFFFIRAGELIAVGDQDIGMKVTGKLICIPASLVQWIAQFDPA